MHDLAMIWRNVAQAKIVVGVPSAADLLPLKTRAEELKLSLTYLPEEGLAIFGPSEQVQLVTGLLKLY